MTVCSLLTLDLQKETRKTVQIVQILGPPKERWKKHLKSCGQRVHAIKLTSVFLHQNLVVYLMLPYLQI